MNELAKWVWVVIVLTACCGPWFFLVMAVVLVVLSVLAFIKPGWFGLD